uniref:Putative glucose transporter type 3 n=1 Tax=Nosema pernyi TaxID=1112939 RepID=X5DYP8_9MICR|nr:putative glucose transporter type 3 [Nosema pernyi]
MDTCLENSTVVMFENGLSKNVEIDMKTTESEKFLNIGEDQKFKTETKPKVTTLQKTSTYLMCFLISFVIGYSFTSYGLIVSHGLKFYSTGFFPENHELLKNLCPAVLYFGSSVGTFAMLMIKQYSHLKAIHFSSFLFAIGYILQSVYPHIMMIFFTRFLIGIASGVCCMVIPQVLYFSCRQGIRGLITSLFPFFIMVGLTSAVALMPLLTPLTIYPFNAIPLVAIVASILCSGWTYKLEDVKKEKGFIEVTKFMFQSHALKSTISVILAHVFQKTTGVDFIGNFSGSLFTGDYAQIKNISPLIVAGVANLATGFLPDIFGRKLPIVVTLSLLCLVTLSMGIWGTNVWSLILFTIVYNGGLGAVPYYYQNETVPAKYIPDINEIATFSNVLLALFVALYAAFLLSPSNTTIWYTFSGLSLIGAIIMGITMPETKGTPIENRDFIKNWFNFSFKNKNLG